MSIRNLSSYLVILSQTSDYEQIFSKIKRLDRVQAALSDIIPPQFRNRCQVGQYTADGFLLIYTDSGAAAARLRTFIPSIQRKMDQAGFRISNIKLSVLPHLYPDNAESSPKNTHSLSRAAIKHLDRLSGTLPTESPLKSSLRALLANSYNK